jgi:hypothetical protein
MLRRALMLSCLAWFGLPAGGDSGPSPAFEGRSVATEERQARRHGRVRADRGILVDDGGPFLALGASLFWALWGERHDPDRLDRNLQWLADHDFDYIRMLGMVGTESWRDRAIDPAAPDYWPIVDRLFARLARHGLRAQVTVFADAQAMMRDPAARERFAQAWAEYAERHAAQVLLIETANEYARNGLEAGEVRALTRRMNDRTAVLVASSAPPGAWPGVEPDRASADDRAILAEWQTLYGGGVADALTFHADRDTGQPGGAWRPVSELWALPDAGGDIPRLWINNEPIGPQSSLASDDDPVRLAMSAAMSWISGMAAYTLHTGAGVRGGGAADRDLGRAANLWEVAQIDRTAAMLRQARAALPATVPNWRRVSWHEAGHPCRITPAQDEHDLSAHVAAIDGDRFVMASIGVRRPLDCVSTVTAPVQVFRPPFAAPARVDARDGQPLRIEPPAQIVVR